MKYKMLHFGEGSEEFGVQGQRISHDLPDHQFEVDIRFITLH